MKKIILVLIILQSTISCYSQTQTFLLPIKVKKIIVDSLYFTNMQYPISKILIIMPNGDVYYDPSKFCDCKKCKEFNGLRKFINN